MDVLQLLCFIVHEQIKCVVFSAKETNFSADFVYSVADG